YSAAEPGWWSARVLDHIAPQSRCEAASLSARLGIAADRLEEAVTHLSTGERQRLALVRALVAHPPVLLLDEPTGALDEATTRQVETVLGEQLAAGTTLILVTHSREQAERLGQRHLRMEARHLLGREQHHPTASP
ncbi:MAG: ATP-binding cassette domain-containing protein, partial [Acetobacteraceae bacterium]|nr:ATP-binding cassette domain-containing protein [Acetobacteraceae bacterium]